MIRRRKAAAQYNNDRPTTLCRYGFSHRSRLEFAVCFMTWLQERAGELKHLAHEESVRLGAAGYRCIPDFKLQDAKTGEIFYREAKGYANPRWPTTQKQWAAYGPGRLEVWKGTHNRPLLEKVIVPLENVCPHCGK